MFELIPYVAIDTMRLNPTTWHTVVNIGEELVIEQLVTNGRVIIRQWNDEKLAWETVGKFYLDGRSNDD